MIKFDLLINHNKRFKPVINNRAIITNILLKKLTEYLFLLLSVLAITTCNVFLSLLK